jgi:hypothetical protein
MTKIFVLPLLAAGLALGPAAGAFAADGPAAPGGTTVDATKCVKPTAKPTAKPTPKPSAQPTSKPCH